MNFTLDQIKSYARKNRQTQYNIVHCTECLVCDMIKSMGFGEYPHFGDTKNLSFYANQERQNAEVAQEYADMCKTALVKYDMFFLSGSQIERAIDRIQNGEAPDIVALSLKPKKTDIG